MLINWSLSAGGGGGAVDYALESDTRAGVTYAFGAKVGTLEVVQSEIVVELDNDNIEVQVEA
jgi:hypothetical protein